MSNTAVSWGSRTWPVLNPVPATAEATKVAPLFLAKTSVKGPPESGLAWAMKAAGEPLFDVTPGARASRVELSVDISEET